MNKGEGVGLSFNVLLTLLSPAKTMSDTHKRIFMSAFIAAGTGYLIKWSISAIWCPGFYVDYVVFYSTNIFDSVERQRYYLYMKKLAAGIGNAQHLRSLRTYK